MFAAIDDALAGLYPGRSWHPSWPRRYDADRDAAALADELADELRTATFVRPAGDGGCAFIYVLAMGRPPCAIQVRDADLPVPDEWTVDGGVIRERYLRIALATATPFAVVQELAVDVEPDTGGVLVREQALSGVQIRMQSGMAVLATIGSTAPFVGLFGTVWAIYTALVKIGASGQASIDRVAGPVGEALIMTAIGLAVAVPAVFGYNWLLRQNKLAFESLRNFGAQLHSLLLATTDVTQHADAAPVPEAVVPPVVD